MRKFYKVMLMVLLSFAIGTTTCYAEDDYNINLDHLFIPLMVLI